MAVERSEERQTTHPAADCEGVREERMSGRYARGLYSPFGQLIS